MDTQEILAKLTPVFRDVLDNDRIALAPEMTARDVEGWDSLANIRLMITIEEEFRVKFDVGEFQEYRNVGDLAAGVKRRLASH
ncbi:MAG TPA: acyl carrier protein [Bryobacteraceae bacterium]|jgi:acyl carrier protein|nr:acyl carrier protein [Bryobacteraceae bacterium]